LRIQICLVDAPHHRDVAGQTGRQPSHQVGVIHPGLHDMRLRLADPLTQSYDRERIRNVPPHAQHPNPNARGTDLPRQAIQVGQGNHLVLKTGRVHCGEQSIQQELGSAWIETGNNVSDFDHGWLPAGDGLT
jgi:hypothetical protein